MTSQPADRPYGGSFHNPKKAAYFNTIDYVPHAKQWLYHDSTARFRLANCGRRFGKSTMAARDLEPRLFEPSRRFWIVGPTYDLGEKEFRVIWDDLIIRMRLGLDKRVKKGYSKKQGTMFIEFPWQTRLEVRSADHPENLVGEALDHVIMSEAAKQKQDTWERFIRPALADRRGSADFPTTPEGFNWLYELWMMGQNPDFPMYESWRFPSWDNDAVYPGGYEEEEIQLLKATMGEDQFLQEIAADFASFVGKIYPDWNVETHVKQLKFNPAWKNYIAFDWGYTNPLAAIEFQVSPDDTIYVWREHYKPFLRLEQHIAELRNRPQPEGYHLDLAFGDAADPEAADYVTQHFVPCWALPEAKENWRDGVDLVRGFMKGREIGIADEFGTPLSVPGMYVDFSCVNFIREASNYKAPDSVKGRNVPEFGNKVEDHAMDAIRYGLVHLFKLGSTDQLGDVMNVSSGGSSAASSGVDGSFVLDGMSLSGAGGAFTMDGEF